MTSFVLKIIGIITMFCDHVGYIILGNFSFLNLIGRFAFPIFAFQSVQGYIHTKDLKKHLKKLLLFACISQIPFMLFLSISTNDIYRLNVLFTFIFGLFAIFMYEKSSNKYLGFLSVLILAGIAQLLKTDYGFFGVMLIFAFYFFKDKKIYMVISSVILIVLQYLYYIIKFPTNAFNYFLIIIFTCLPLIFICFYNKKEGPKAKYLFYIFYPLHQLIIFLIWFFWLK